ncbi:hypothetical protein Poli38472_008288 [Pythium oligandrum]|uniref:Uncharacterized protein n=1 Tax=Pythium oligandrum TaxID=41045 RepID=A0A8K1CL58_PYTOL|nr:hypothetical protein Poli38472_008288 [Pythium oligandrum]|eukprot:TMW65646.1 hypothetical protein Poli38472_008288 [Pythium oligandrum]
MKLTVSYTYATSPVCKQATRTGIWTSEEHRLYLEAMKELRGAPWKEIAAYIGTRTVRQVLSHHQKYLRKVKRHASSESDAVYSREEHAVDLSVLDACPRHRRRRRLSTETEVSGTSESDWEFSSNSSVATDTTLDTLLDQEIFETCDPADTLDIEVLFSFLEKVDTENDWEMNEDELLQASNCSGFPAQTSFMPQKCFW